MRNSGFTDPGLPGVFRLLIANSSPLFRNRYLHRSRNPPPEVSLHLQKLCWGDPSRIPQHVRIATRNANMLSQIPIILACADMGFYKMYERADS
jgi:hypothetical protein